MRQIIHILEHQKLYVNIFKKLGAGRDGEFSKAIMYYNNRDIAKNKPRLEDKIRMYCQSKNKCLRSLLLEYLDANQTVPVQPGHLCCSVCKNFCSCIECKLNF